MEFVAEDPLHIVVRNGTPPIVAPTGGQIAAAGRRVYAKFERGTASSHARQLGLRIFEFRRIPGNVMQEQWLAYYDSVEDQDRHGWTDEERDAIEKRLLNSEGVVRVEKPRIAIPWPAYDKLVAGGKEGLTRTMVAEKIAATVDELGLNPRTVIGYEQQEKARSEVIAALEALIPAEERDAEDTDDDGLVIEA